MSRKPYNISKKLAEAGVGDYTCNRLSFFELSELLIPDENQRRPLTRICSMMRKREAEIIQIHNRVDCEDYYEEQYPGLAEELRDIATVVGRCECSVRQLNYYGKPFEKDKRKARPRKGVVTTPLTHQHLGTCVIATIIPEKPWNGKSRIDYVYEAIIVRPQDNNEVEGDGASEIYIHVYADTEVSIMGEKYAIDASIFCQQNGITSVCAHACLKMALWHAINEVQPPAGKMNQVAREVCAAGGRKFDPSQGLHMNEVKEICSHYGAKLMVVDFLKPDRMHLSAYELAYLLIESGIPTILVFKPNPQMDDKTHHMVPVIGHTMNADEWYPMALSRYRHLPETALHTAAHEYLSSAEWASHLVIHDDLLGPYMWIGHDTLTRHAAANDTPAGRASAIIAVMPNYMNEKQSPVTAQEIARLQFWAALEDHVLDAVCEPWQTRIRQRWIGDEHLKKRGVVFRTQLITGERYIRHLKKSPDHWGNRSRLTDVHENKIREHLPERVWLVELSMPRLFTTNSSKLGEILVDPKALEDDDLVKATLDVDLGGEIDSPLLFRLVDVINLFDDSGRIQIGYSSHTSLYSRKDIDYEFERETNGEE